MLIEKMLSDPAPYVVIGLSNLSQGSTERGLINRAFLVMAVQAGLDASIHDPLDTELMDAMITAEVLLNKMIYSDSTSRHTASGKSALNQNAWRRTTLLRVFVGALATCGEPCRTARPEPSAVAGGAFVQQGGNSICHKIGA